MNLVLWVLQAALALLYLPAGFMKVFTLDKVQEQFPSMKAWPRAAWHASGVLEIVCGLGLLVPWPLTPAFAGALAIEAVLLSARHVKAKETAPAISSGVFAAAAAFVACGRLLIR